MELLGLGRAWQITIMINRYSEGIEDEKATIEKSITEIQARRPEFR